MSTLQYVEMEFSACKRAENLLGRVSGRVTITKFLGKTSYRQPVWRYMCECGNAGVVLGGNFRKIQSCGCLARENQIRSATSHGMTKTSEWNIWKGAKKRCRLKTDPAYHNYGARGIDMCDEWYNSFEAFYRDMGPRPPKLQLERIDNNGNYEPGNCKWATSKEENRNKRSNHIWEHGGRKMCISEWSEFTGIRKDTLRRRVVVYGWSIEKALTKGV